MKIYSSILFTAYFLLISFYTYSQNIQDSSILNKTIIIRGDNQFTPFEFINEKGEPDGFNVTLYKSLMKHLGLKYDLQLCDFAQARKDIEENKIDILSMLRTPLRSEYVDFCIPHCTIEYSLISRFENSFNTLDDIQDKQIIVQSKDGAHDFLLQKGTFKHIVPVKTIEEGLRLLNNGEYDVMLSYGISAYYFIRKNNFQNLTIQNINHEPFQFCIAVNKENNALVDVLNMGIYQMKLSGEYDQIYDSWFGVHEHEKFLKDSIPYIIIFLSIIIFMILFIWLLRIKIKKTKFYIDERESRFFQIFNSINDAIFIFDKKTNNVVNCNTTAISMFRVPDKDFILALNLKNYFEEIGIDSQQKNQEAIKGPFSFKHRMRRLDKTYFWADVEVKSALIGLQDRILCVMRDISEQKSNELKLENLSNQIRIAINAGDISVWLYNLKTKLITSVHGTVLFDGFTLDECQKYMSDDNMNVFLTRIDDLLHNKIQKACDIFKFTNPIDMKDVYYESMMTTVKSDDGIITQIIGTQKNITSKHNIQKQLEEYQIKTSLAIQAAEATQFDYDCTTRSIHLIRTDKINQQIFNVPILDVINHVHPQDKKMLIEKLAQMDRGENETFSFEMRIILPRDSVYQWGIFNITPFNFDSDKKVSLYTGIWRNSSKWHDISDELLVLRDKAEESNRLKSAFLANLSHEIRTPLNAIVGFSELLIQNDNLPTNEKKDYISIITNNTDILLQLMNDIMELAKMESQPIFSLMYSDISIEELFHNIIQTVYIKLKAKNLNITYQISPPDLIIKSDINRIRQILNNLISNAIKFSTKGNINILCKLQNDALYFSVSDNGCGIPIEQSNYIFERFVKLDPFSQGSGLGLSICKYLVTKMDGSIGVISKQNEGSTFWFTLPYLKTTMEETMQKIRKSTVSEQKTAELTMLVAEDDASNFKLIQTIFKDYQIIHAWDGKEAVRLCKAENPHIILMDIKMPNMNGYDAVKEIRKEFVHTPIIAVTAYAFEDDENRIKASGFDDYESKPLYPIHLREKVRNLIKTRWNV